MFTSQDLADIGLHDSEIRVYLFLLREGLSTPPQIARGTKIARTHCYGLVGSLKQKGLIEVQRRGKRKAYLASDPESLVRTLDYKREKIVRLLPELRAAYTTQKNKPKINFYEGSGEIAEIFRQTLVASEIFSFGSTAEFERVMPQFFVQYQKLVQQKNIVFRDILTDASKASAEKIKAVLRGLYDLTLLPSKYGEVSTNILLWDNNLALIDFSEPMFGTVLTNTSLARTFRIMCEVIKNSLHAVPY